ncbi:MAG TPA: hypothetical protein VN820_02615 [Acidimicrobiales bacterium]|nr:hypothetical protein [Acidimicrobiales bacterium]
MLNVNFVFLGVAIAAVGQLLYVRDTIQGRTQPNRVTWLLWAIAPLLAFAVEVNDGVGLRSLATFMFGFGPLLVFGASFVNPKSVWKLGPLDYTCGAVSLGGTIGWLVTRQGLVALAAALLADALAGVPTLVKSWRRPESESASVYVGAFASAAITLLTVTRVTAAEVAFPLYIVIIALVEVALVAGRLGPRWRRAPAAVTMAGELDVEQ